MDEFIRAVVDHDGRAVDWKVLIAPRDMANEIQGLCNAVDEFLLDHPGFRVTVAVERPLPTRESGV